MITTASGTGLAFHRAKKEKEAWEVEERKALLDAEKASMSADLQSLEDTAVQQHGGDEA